jgi:two-component system, OmpR family, response regulator CpxR
MNQAILLIDDDIEFCDLLREYLVGEGFSITTKHDGESGYQEASTGQFDVIILDVMLPKMNGFKVLEKIKQSIETPVLMLTAKGGEVDQVAGLEIGADDYLPKPCSPRLLVARLNAILRRKKKTNHDLTHSAVLKFGDITLNKSNHEVSIAGRLIDLTNSEYNIMACLMEKPEQVVTKEVLSEQALNRKIQAFDRSVDMHISHLRTKLNATGNTINIKTIRGVGYLMET